MYILYLMIFVVVASWRDERVLCSSLRLTLVGVDVIVSIVAVVVVVVLGVVMVFMLFRIFVFGWNQILGFLYYRGFQP